MDLAGRREARRRAGSHADEAKKLLSALDGEPEPVGEIQRWQQGQMLMLANTQATMAVYYELKARRDG